MSACITGAAVAFIRGTARIKDMDTETAVKDPALIGVSKQGKGKTLTPAFAADQTEVTIKHDRRNEATPAGSSTASAARAIR